MQESLYESGNCVQIICAIQGVHPKGSGATWVQNPPEFPAKTAQTTLGKARGCNTIAYLRKSAGWRFEPSPVHQLLAVPDGKISGNHHGEVRCTHQKSSQLRPSLQQALPLKQLLIQLLSAK